LPPTAEFVEKKRALCHHWAALVDHDHGSGANRANECPFLLPGLYIEATFQGSMAIDAERQGEKSRKRVADSLCVLFNSLIGLDPSSCKHHQFLHMGRLPPDFSLHASQITSQTMGSFGHRPQTRNETTERYFLHNGNFSQAQAKAICASLLDKVKTVAEDQEEGIPSTLAIIKTWDLVAFDFQMHSLLNRNTQDTRISVKHTHAFFQVTR